MEKFCVKGYLKRSGKRVLSILLCACMIGTMIPITARAETEGTSVPSNGEVTCTCANLCTEDKVNSDCPVCGTEEADLSKCTGKVQSENNEKQLNTGESEEAKNETELTITAWEWIDEEELINPETGILALPFANEETPAFFDDVVALLPTQIQATVENTEDTEAEAASETITLGDWSCEEYPKEGAYSGSYTFAAALPEGYVLSEEAKALNVLVELGGAQMYDSVESEATGAFTVTGGILGTDYEYVPGNEWEGGVLTIKNGASITIRNTAPNTATSDRIEVAEWVDANITLAGVNIDVSYLGDTAAFKIADDSGGNVTITLADDSVNTLKSGDNCAGLQKNGGGEDIGKLTIQGGTNGTGKLIAEGGGHIGGAGIGGGGNDDGSNIEISGGIVEATDISQGAGIGGSGSGTGSNITISGGTVTATGGVGGGAGIGGGGSGNGSNITISGGTVTATGRGGGAGIGGGNIGSGSDITISGGSVKAVASSNAIGGGTGYGAVTPTSNGETPVYLLEIENEAGADITINETPYPTNHNGEKKIYAYLPAKTVTEPNVVTVGQETTKYIYDNSKWLIVSTGAYDEEGFCTNYEWKDGSLVLKDGIADGHTDCNGYEPATDSDSDGVYEIDNAGQLYWFAALVNGTNGLTQNLSANAVLTDNITVNTGVLDASGNLAGNTSGFRVWTPIVGISYPNYYAGTFDGQNHTVSGLYFNDSDVNNVGLFGATGSSGKISKVGVVDSYFCGKDRVGGVCGSKYGTVENCYSASTVSGEDSVGGVCGDNYKGNLLNCYNTGAVNCLVSNGWYIGGVCGILNDGTIQNCYSTGTVGGSSTSVGGVCGQTQGTSANISNCYFDSSKCDKNAVGLIHKGTVEKTEGKTTNQFASGEVCYLLNDSTSENPVWYQRLNTDTYPNLDNMDSENRTVYVSVPCPSEFFNTSGQVVAHIFEKIDDTNHKCKVCGLETGHSTETLTYTADEDTNEITVKCGDECGKEYGTVTLSAPTEDLIYDGTAKAATVSDTVDGVDFSTTPITYKQGETTLTSAPKDAGTYTASITLGTGEDAASVSVEYTIDKATPTISWGMLSGSTWVEMTSMPVTYTGSEIAPNKLVPPTVTLVNGETYSGEISYSYRVQGSSDAFTSGLPTAIGTYEVKASIAADGNYKEAASTVKLIVNWLNTTAAAVLTDQKNATLSGDTWWAQSVTFTAPTGFTISNSVDGTYGTSFVYDTQTGTDGTEVTYYLKDTTSGEIAQKTATVRIDRTTPTWPADGGINIKNNRWKEFLNTISFGLFFKETLDVKASAADDLCGVAAYYYYVDETDSTTVLSFDELANKTFTEVEGSGKQTLTSLRAEGSYVVYAYAVDKAGNKSDYVCSDGVVLDQTAPTISDTTTPSKEELTLTDTSAKISFTGSEAGTYFYMVRKSSETAPTSITDFATSETDNQGMTVWTANESVTADAMTADNSNKLSLTGLTANTAYTVYVIGVDRAGNASDVLSNEFTTCKTMPEVTTNPTLSGTYGTAVSAMTLEKGVAKAGDTEITGTWTLTDGDASDVPSVGTTNTYEVTFTPDAKYNGQYETVKVSVKPTVERKAVTVAAENKTKTYGQDNPALTFTVPEGSLVGSDTVEALGVTLSCEATKTSPVKEGGYAITGTSNSANYQVTVIPGVLTITKATPVITATTSYSKTYGDIKFFLDATDNSTEASLQYAVTESKDTSDSAVENDAIVSVDARGYVTIKGAGSAKITASLSETTNYNAASREITITVDKAAAAPNMPAETMDVPYHCEKVSDVPLPEDWVWQEADKSTELSIDRIVTADAVYDGADKGNYVKETVSVSLTRKDISGGLCIEEISDRTYNGKQIRPEVWVYYEKQLLTAGKDYTVSYKNNTNAAAADAVNAKGASIAPTVTVKGKGNYTGTVTKTFTIKPINLDNYKTDAQLQEILTIEPVCAKHTGKFIKATPTVKLNGKKLALSAKQYTCEYNDGNTRDQEAYKDCGTYNITIVGSEKNFVGETTVTETISGELISKATITLDRSSYPYDKETGETFPAKVTVKYGKNTLTEGIDYTVSYKDYDKIGTAAVIITGMGNYSGVKTKTYKITGTKLTSRMITQINKSFSYDGTEHSVENGTDYKIEDGTAGLVEGKNYTVAYKGDRTKAGSFKVTFSGIGAYSGTVTKTFTIQKASVSTLTVTLPDESVAYTKGGVKPKPEVRFGGVLLIEGTDYTVTYQNNTKAASAEDKKAPCLYITGKGSFTGNTKASPVKFTIMQAPLSAQTIVVDNVPYKNRNGNYVPAITITDSTTGKKLAKNTDYSGSFTYEIWDAAAGDYVSFTGKKVETSEDNIRMRVTISAKGSYSGEASVEYEICPKSIASVKVEKIPNQEYTGQAIAPKLTITDNGADLTEGIHYTVEYTNNIKKGTATVTIRGKGQYGGSKTVKFKITSRIFKWS